MELSLQKRRRKACGTEWQRPERYTESPLLCAAEDCLAHVSGETIGPWGKKKSKNKKQKKTTPVLIGNGTWSCHSAWDSASPHLWRKWNAHTWLVGI